MSELPKGWGYQQIASFIPDKKGAVKIGPFGSQLKSDEMVESGIKVLGQENIIANDFSLGDRYISEAKYEKLKSCTVFPGDILVSMMGTIGLSREVPANYQTAIMDSHLLRIQVDSTKVCKDYFCKVLHEYQDIKSQLHRMSQGGIMSGLNSQIIHSLKFPIPPLNEQKKIAEILTSVDKVIELTEIEIEKLKNLKKGMMQDLLTKGIEHTKFKDSPIGKIPKSWTIRKLIDCVDGKGKYGANASAVQYDYSKPRYIRITDISESGSLIDEEKKSIELSESNGYLLKKGDFLFARTGNTVGKSYLHKNDSVDMAYAGYLIKFDCNREVLLPEYLEQITHSSEYYDWVEQSSRTGAQPNINGEEYGQMQLRVPPINEQQEIIRILSSIDKNLQLKNVKLNKTQMKKKGLMQDLLTGKVRVKV